MRGPVEFLERCNDRYGECFTVRFPGLGDVVYVTDPTVAQGIFTGGPARYHAGEANSLWLEPIVGRFSLLTLDEREHLQQRKLLLPPFHGDRIRRYEELFYEVTHAEIDSWPLHEEFSLLDATRRITLEVILRAVLGADERARVESLRAAILRLDKAADLVLPFPFVRRDLGRLSPWRRFLDARAHADDLVFAEIRRGREDPALTERGDVLALLLQAEHDDGSPMADTEIRDELMTLLAAGYETASTSLAWCFERVLRTPAVYDRLLAAPGDDEYIDATIKETLRLRSPLIDSTRMVTEDTEVAGHVIPAGTLLVIAMPLVHRRPANFPPDPGAFRPERFGDGPQERYGYIPFGGGVRRCIGAAFGQLEMKVVLRAILERTRLRADRPEPERQRLHHVVVVPSRGARVVLTERRPASTPPAARERVAV